MTIFFTSDSHFNHANVIEHDNRPFLDLDHMTEQLVINWNSVVTESDIVYHLGDFAISRGKKDTKLIDDILARLSGTKHLITGNHDRKEVTSNPRWSKVTSYDELHIKMGGVHKQRIVMCHYALQTWNQSHRGSWDLFGHSHGQLYDLGGKKMDVGVTCNNYTPVSLEQVAEFMATRGPVSYAKHKPVCSTAEPDPWQQLDLFK